MNTSNMNNSLKEQVDSLEASIGQLLEICNTLSVENAAFKKSNHQLLIDRSNLHEKNDKARVQVEAMINRLKTIDSTS
jgi:cell division protein ZapB